MLNLIQIGVSDLKMNNYYCKYLNCLNNKIKYSDYCVLHKCNYKYCLNDKLLHNYCKYHLCNRCKIKSVYRFDKNICLNCWIKNEYIYSINLNYFQLLPIELIENILIYG